MSCVRWAFRFSEWNPKENEWNQCLECIELKEKERIGKFKRPNKGEWLIGRFNSDAKSSLIGRLMLRLFLLNNHFIRESNAKKEMEELLSRSQYGKPFINVNLLLLASH
eukprot:TRINITY_DN5015_c0_g1_i3.p2 TRINITY_DN5015_c0_g1~~TRINITY_DN5015_c0_g1_i3.p2  ORF type:complete len:109 (+),score=48.66 TRINITY_DN5015_c0_g1_i3:95-421(+)